MNANCIKFLQLGLALGLRTGSWRCLLIRTNEVGNNGAP
jgi:hypothetical protein